MKKYTSAYFYVIIDDKEKVMFYEFDKSELLELKKLGLVRMRKMKEEYYQIGEVSRITGIQRSDW